MSVKGGPNPKIRRMSLQSPSSGNLQGRLGEEQGLQAAESESSDMTGEHSPASGRSEENEEEAEGSRSSDPSRMRMKMEILSQRTEAPAHRPQGTPLSRIPAGFSSQPEGTENFQQMSMAPAAN